MRYTPKNQSLAIMQPYFLPYIGYFQLLNAVDNFVIYDNIKYSKKYFVNKNSFLQNDKPCVFSLALKKDSDYLHINERYISQSFNKEKLLDSIYFAYKKAPYHNALIPLLESILNYPKDNLFDFIYHSILKVCIYLGIDTNIIISSTLPINHHLKAQDKVIAICKAMNASKYINSIGGITLYNEDDFSNQNIKLRFLQVAENMQYTQFDKRFTPNLSIIDVIAFNSKDEIKNLLLQYKIISMGGGSPYLNLIKIYFFIAFIFFIFSLYYITTQSIFINHSQLIQNKFSRIYPNIKEQQ